MTPVWLSVKRCACPRLSEMWVALACPGLGGRLHLRFPGQGAGSPTSSGGPAPAECPCTSPCGQCDKLLLGLLQQAAVYFQRQKQVLQGSLSSCSWTHRSGSSHTCGVGAGASLRLMGRTASRPPPALLWKPEGHLRDSTLLSAPEATPFGDNAVKLETNLSPHPRHSTSL